MAVSGQRQPADYSSPKSRLRSQLAMPASSSESAEDTRGGPLAGEAKAIRALAQLADHV